MEDARMQWTETRTIGLRLTEKFFLRGALRRGYDDLVLAPRGFTVGGASARTRSLRFPGFHGRDSPR